MFAKCSKLRLLNSSVAQELTQSAILGFKLRSGLRWTEEV